MTAVRLTCWTALVLGADALAGTGVPAPKATVAAGLLDVAASPGAMPKGLDKTLDLPDPLDLFPLQPPIAGPPKGPTEFQLNLGRAIDTLRVDYPRLFTHKPDFSIFAKDIELWDPSGKRLQGLKQYERVFDMLRFLRRGTMQDAQVKHRLVVTDKTIRLRWSAELWMRDPALGITNFGNGEAAVVHLDGVSVYELDDNGFIRAHRLENIVMKGQQQAEEQVNLAFAWPMPGIATPELATPFFRTLDAAMQVAADSAANTNDARTAGGAQAPLLRARAPARAPAPQAMAGEGGKETPMERAARERAEDAAAAALLAAKRAEASQQTMPRAPPRFGFGLDAPQICETSYDCDAPLVCCDLLFASVCCSGGLMIPSADPVPQGELIPIPVERDEPGPYPGVPPQYPGAP